jgi:DNA-binding Lrp family transcriptional regulator
VKIDLEEAKVIGLDKNDLKILDVLKSENLTILQISIKTKIPRTSLYYTLNTLKNRGFIKKIKIDKKTYWRKKTDRNIKASLSKIINKITSEDNNNFSKQISNNTNIIFLEGAKNLEEIFWDVLKIPDKKRMFGFQPNASILQVVKKMPVKNIIKFNNEFKRKKLISEGIVHESSVEEIKKILKPEESKAFFESFGGRSADTSKLPDKYMDDVKSEIYLYDGKIALMNWYEEFGIIIENPDMYALIFEMFKSTKYLMDKYNQNEKIAMNLIKIEEEK